MDDSTRALETASMKARHLRKSLLPRLTSAQRAWWTRTLAIIAALGCLAYWYVVWSSGTPNPSQPETNAASDRNSSAYSLRSARETPPADRANQKQFGRTVYAYSVVPGGIASVAELQSAMAKDSVVFAQYAAFHLERARVIRLDQDRLAHVSYRVGDQIYWTNRQLKLAKGETLITDGVQTARTRCGNFISEIAEAPVSPHEPIESEFNKPVQIAYNPDDAVSDNRFPELVQPPPSVPPPFYEPPVEGNPWSGGGPGPVYFPPPVPIRFPSGTPPPPPLVVNTPEPGTGTQLLLALVVILFLRKCKVERRA
jgi:hypothetical protein